MIPLKDHNPTERTPYVTIALIVANVLVFFTEPLRAAEGVAERFFLCKASIPLEVTRWEIHPEIAQLCPNKTVIASILFSMFLHGSILHIAGNMIFLWVFGNNIEDRLGPIKYLLFYLACGVAATLAQSYTTPNSPIPLIGASGAVAGVLGGYLILFPRAVVRTLVIFVFITILEIRAWVLLAFWLFLQVVSQAFGEVAGTRGGVAYMAHIGGFIAGMILVFALGARRAPPARPQWDWAR